MFRGRDLRRVRCSGPQEPHGLRDPTSRTGITRFRTSVAVMEPPGDDARMPWLIWRYVCVELLKVMLLTTAVLVVIVSAYLHWHLLACCASGWNRNS